MSSFVGGWIWIRRAARASAVRALGGVRHAWAAARRTCSSGPLRAGRGGLDAQAAVLGGFDGGAEVAGGVSGATLQAALVRLACFGAQRVDARAELPIAHRAVVALLALAAGRPPAPAGAGPPPPGGRRPRRPPPRARPP